MRIDSINKVNQVYNANTSVRGIAASTSKEKDAVVISKTGRDLQIAKKAMKDIPDVRTDLVERIKREMASGTYDVTSSHVADKLIERVFDVQG